MINYLKQHIQIVWAVCFLLVSNTAFAQIGDVAAGQSLYNSNCFSCHGSPKFSSPSRAANNPNVISAAINNINTMRFLQGAFTGTDLNNMAAYINSVVNPVSIAAQTITFPTISTFVWKGGSTTLAASASSGLAVSYSVLSGPCNVSGSLLTASAAGSCTIAANQSGNSSFSAAPQVTQTVTAQIAPQAISFPTITPFAWNSGQATLAATANSGLAVSYTVQSGPCQLNGATLTATAAGTCVVAANQSGNANYSAASQATASVAVTVGDFSDMWWAGEVENGWGVSIQQHGETQFNALYVYDADGQPRWYVMPGGSWNSDFTAYSGLLYQPTSAAFNVYDAAQFVVGASPGMATITFTGPATATLQYTINGISAQKNIMRQTFGGGVGPFNVNDLWYKASENGWGVNIAQHGDTLFAVWYTYGSDGKTRWLVMPGGSWAGNVYTGSLFKTVSSPWLGVPYNPTQLQVTPVGMLTLTFGDIVNGVANSAAMRYTVDEGSGMVDQTKSITRQPY